MLFKLRQMEIFRAVMTTGSVSGAAKLLFVSQPAISRSIAYTEQKLGLVLFERSSGRLVPTPEAYQLLREVNTVYHSAIRVNELAFELATRSSGTLDLSANPCLGVSIMPEIISEFVTQNPDIKIRYRTSLSADMPMELLSKKVDLAVCALPLEHPNLHVAPLCKGQMVCILPTDHPLNKKQVLSLADVAAYPLVSYQTDSPFGLILAQEFERAGLEFRAGISVQRSDQACALVRRGGWVAIIDEFTVREQIWSGLVIRPLKETIPVQVSIVTSKHESLSTQARRFITTLQRSVMRNDEPKAPANRFTATQVACDGANP
jgi:DNA-binding transcriptional LysR family regulator